jgi:hypothetical protein
MLVLAGKAWNWLCPADISDFGGKMSPRAGAALGTCPHFFPRLSSEVLHKHKPVRQEFLISP